MNILIDIGHPGHVHLYRNFALEMQKNGHHILFTCREKEFEIELLTAAGFNFVSFGKKFKSIKGKIKGLFIFNYKMLKVALKFKPDLFLSVGSMYAAQVSFLLRKPHITLEDTGNLEQVRLYLPFTKVVFSPHEIKQDLGKKQIRYHSYHELAYLNPKHFKPNKDIYNFLKIKPDEKYAVIRFVAWNATHDVGQGGFNSDQKDEIVSYLSENYKLFISSENFVPEKFQKYIFKIPPDKIHDALAFADIVVSEGATMASEAGVLGIPTIYVNSLRACNNEDQEKYGLVFNFQSGAGVLEKIKELEKIDNRKAIFQQRRDSLLNDKINLTLLLIWVVENYPKSIEILKSDPNIQKKFQIKNGLYS